ncbi:MAG TPA: auxin efflux carrier family protein [Gammaproteobacteria bacterium]|uniref:AEC family transporter n=1 Tax=Immundisolibacter sp. TaxID=1934948 RepID=UPI000E8B39A8|nr:auxin efflux carrier family protein [Gammaproteobacteria bacterium]HCZ48125.1 auxin efflux carrier family protein [Gammaproteobacteria bacterium]MCH77563.1 auxin efflux carrier family protein [Gammaproteobacteria bacterium]
MYESLLPMILILASGLVWRHLQPGGVPIQQIRQVVNALVVNLLAPALILGVFLTAQPDTTLLRVPLAGWLVIAVCLGGSLLVFGAMLRVGRLTRPQAGAAILAASFGNGLGAALPVVESLLGTSAARVPLLYDMFATVVVFWSLGVVLAAWFGGAAVGWRSALVVLRMPPFWATVLALAVNLSGIKLPDGVVQSFVVLGQATVPMLLFVVGSTFTLRGLSRLDVLAPVLLIRLCLGFAVGVLAVRLFGLDGELASATLLVAVAPSVAVGIAISERFSLDSELFTASLTATTVVYVLLAPLLV